MCLRISETMGRAIMLYTEGVCETVLLSTHFSLATLVIIQLTLSMQL